MATPKRPRVQAPSVLSGEQRINKLLAAAGLGSRRQVDELIQQGRVEIDGKTISQVGVKVDANAVKISVDGEPLKRHRPVYFAVHKPAGVLCTNRDPEGRPRVIDLVPGNQRLFPVGRLDASSTGLILLTNDGELAQRLAHPRHSVPKNYFVVVAGQVEIDAMRRLQRGIYLAEGLARVDGAKIRKVRKGCTEIDITLSEGKNREIRRVLARLGHRVVTLRRTGIGPLRLATLPEGGYRPLTSNEVAELYQAVEDIKREKKNNRKEREKRRADEMASLDQPIPAEHARPKESATEKNSGDNKSTRKPKKSKRDSVEIDAWDDQVNGRMDTLPPMSANPFRTDDDLDDESIAGFNDAILVRETGPVMETSSKRGKVLGYNSDDEPTSSPPNENDDVNRDFIEAMPQNDDDLDDDGLIGDHFESDEFGDDDEEVSFDPNNDDNVSDETVGEFIPPTSPWSRAKPKHPKPKTQQRSNSNGRGTRTSGTHSAPPRGQGDSGPRTSSSRGPGRGRNGNAPSQQRRSGGPSYPTNEGAPPSTSGDSRGRRPTTTSRSRFGDSRPANESSESGSARRGRPTSRGAKRGGKPGYGPTNRKGPGGKGRPPKKR